MVPAHSLRGPLGAGLSQRIIAVFLLSYLPSSCAASDVVIGGRLATPSVCILQSAYVQVTPSSRCDSVAAVPAPLSFAALRGERESRALLLHDTNADLTNVKVEVETAPRTEDGRSTLPAPEMFQVGYVYAHQSQRYDSQSGWFADPLMAIDEEGMQVPNATAQAVWLDFDIPHHVEAGTYKGALRMVGLRSSGDGSTPSSFELHVPLELQIGEGKVPVLKDSTLGFAWSGNWSEDYFANRAGVKGYHKQKFFDTMLKYRMPPDDIYTTDVRSHEDLEALVQAGDNDFNILHTDAWLDKNKQQYCPTSPSSSQSSPPACRAAVQAMIERLRPTVSWLAEKGWISKAYVYGFDEWPEERSPEIRDIFSQVKEAFPELRTHAVLNWQLPPDMPIDIWTISYHKSSATGGPVNEKLWLEGAPRGTKRQVWWYHCVEPKEAKYLNNMVDRSPVLGRMLLWLGALSEAKNGYPTGWLYYKMDAYLLGGDQRQVVPQAVQRQKGQGGSHAFLDYDSRNFVWFFDYPNSAPEHSWYLYDTFVYPSSSGDPIPSVRLASLRDGIEDWEYFRTLPPTKVQEVIPQLVSSATSWKAAPELLEQARTSLLSFGGSSPAAVTMSAPQVMLEQKASLVGEALREVELTIEEAVRAVTSKRHNTQDHGGTPSALRSPSLKVAGKRRRLSRREHEIAVTSLEHRVTA